MKTCLKVAMIGNAPAFLVTAAGAVLSASARNAPIVNRIVPASLDATGTQPFHATYPDPYPAVSGFRG